MPRNSRRQFVIDLDGTLTLPRILGKMEGFLVPLQPYLIRIPWILWLVKWYFLRLKPNLFIAKELIDSQPGDIIVVILTGRYPLFREVTETWLDKHGIRHDRLIFTPEGESDVEFKVDYAYKNRYRIICMVDNMAHIKAALHPILGERVMLWHELQTTATRIS